MSKENCGFILDELKMLIQIGRRTVGSDSLLENNTFKCTEKFWRSARLTIAHLNQEKPYIFRFTTTHFATLDQHSK